MSDDPEPSLSRLDRLRPALLIAAILAGLAYGLLLPGLVEDWFEDALSVLLVVLVLSLAAGAKFGDVLRSFANVRFISIALVLNFVVVPTVAFLLALAILGPYPAIFVGFILYSIAPCTDWFLMFTALAKGDVPLGLALLPVNLVMQVALIPVFLLLFAGRVVPFQLDSLAWTFAMFIAIPMILAGLARWSMAKARSEEWRDEKLSAILPHAQVWSLVLIIFLIFASKAEVISDNADVLGIIMVPVALLFILAFAFSQAASKAMRFTYGERALLSCTTIARNSPIGLAIAVGLFPDEALLQAAVVLPEIIELPVLVLLVRVLLTIRQRTAAPNVEAAV